MDDSKLDTSKSFTADVYLEDGGIRRPVRINDGGWLQILDAQIKAHPVLPTTLWFGCYEENGEAIYIIKEYTKGGSKNGSTLDISNNDYLGFYSKSAKHWRVTRLDGEELIPRSTPEAHISVSTRGGRKWTAQGEHCVVLKGGADSKFLVRIHKVGVYHF
jgi:hypothetical protein